MGQYRLHRVLRRLEAMGAELQSRGGRKHTTIKFGGHIARWPNPHDDPIDDWLLNQILRQLDISREEFFER